jgi:hypothetical protein
MSTLRVKILILCLLSGVLLTGSVIAAPIDVTINDSSNVPVMSVRQQIADFANRYGNPVIVHGALNMNAPISLAYNEGLSNDQAINIISEAAGARPVRVYFVTPNKRSADSLTTITSIVGRRGNISLDLKSVSARTAIEAIAAADNAQVRFPYGIPTGLVSFKSESTTLSQAIYRVAKSTNTQWKLGYLLDSLNPTLPSIASNDRVASSPTATTSGDSSAATVAPSGQQLGTTFGDSSALSTPSSAHGITNIVVDGVPPSTAWPTTKVAATLPPEKPLPRDAAGNILPITIHFPKPAPVQTAPTLTASQQQEADQQSGVAQQQQLQQEYANYLANYNALMAQPGFQEDLNSFPGVSINDGPTVPYQGMLNGTFNTYTPNTGFNLVPDYGYPYNW